MYLWPDLLFLLFVLAMTSWSNFWLSPVLLVWPQRNLRNHPAWNPETVFQAPARSLRFLNCVVWICCGYTIGKVTSKASWPPKMLQCKSDNSSCTCRLVFGLFLGWDVTRARLFCIRVFFLFEWDEEFLEFGVYYHYKLLSYLCSHIYCSK